MAEVGLLAEHGSFATELYLQVWALLNSVFGLHFSLNFKGTVSRDGYFFEGLNILISHRLQGNCARIN
jgi:hypothetical protein